MNICISGTSGRRDGPRGILVQKNGRKDPRYARRPPGELYRVKTDFACMENLAGIKEYESI
jgi:hypothetical protein